VGEGAQGLAADLECLASDRGFALCEARVFFVAAAVDSVASGAGGRRTVDRRVRRISSGDASRALVNLPAVLRVGLVLRTSVSTAESDGSVVLLGLEKSSMGLSEPEEENILMLLRDVRAI